MAVFDSKRDRSTLGRTASTGRALVSWAALIGCVVYGLFAVTAATVELAAILGVTPGGAARSAPPVFVVHAFAGGLAMITGAVQLKRGGRGAARNARLHRALGRTYVGAALFTGLGGLTTALFFEVGIAGVAAFATWTALWLAATAVAVGHARAHRFRSHRAWMIRSYALALVFLTFSFAHPAAEALGMPRQPVYAIAVLGSVLVNLAAAEAFIRLRGRVVAARADTMASLAR